MATVLLTSTTFQIGNTLISPDIGYFARFKVVMKVEKKKFGSSFCLGTFEINTLTKIGI